MPVRPDEQEEKELTHKAGVRESAQKPRLNIDPAITNLAALAVEYVRVKKEIDKLTKISKDKNEKIKTDLVATDAFEVNGKHKELTAPVGDGLNEVFIQLQISESVGYVSDIVAQVRQKLGAKADNFIMVKEVLHDSALEAMRSQGLITDEDVLDWTTCKEVERLIVKINKSQKAPAATKARKPTK